MKSVSTKIGMIAAGVLFAFCTESSARSPEPRQLCGTIQDLNPIKHILILNSPERPKPITLVWRRSTKFIRNQQFSDSAQVKTGLHVCVYYHSPFFGKPFITKMVWAGDE